MHILQHTVHVHAPTISEEFPEIGGGSVVPSPERSKGFNEAGSVDKELAGGNPKSMAGSIGGIVKLMSVLQGLH